MRQPGFAEFPDCVAARSAKHLYELVDMVEAGARAALVYVIQMEADRFDVARDIDPAYDKAFRHALAAGVESYAYVCRMSLDGRGDRARGGDCDAEIGGRRELAHPSPKVS